MPLADFIKSADFKTEKHVPVIEVIRKDNDYIVVGIKVGKEVPHPNTPEHFIAWIDLYYKGEGDNFVQHLGRADFSAHGASIYTEPTASFTAPASCMFCHTGSEGNLKTERNSGGRGRGADTRHIEETFKAMGTARVVGAGLAWPEHYLNLVYNPRPQEVGQEDEFTPFLAT